MPGRGPLLTAEMKKYKKNRDARTCRADVRPRSSERHFVTVPDNETGKRNVRGEGAVMGKPKLQEMLKGRGLMDKDVYAAVGVSHTTYYRWLYSPKTRLQRALDEEAKKAEVTHKRELLDAVRAAALSERRHWTAAAWLLKRRWPEEYGLNRAAAYEARAGAPRFVLGVEAREAGPKTPGDPTGGPTTVPRRSVRDGPR